MVQRPQRGRGPRCGEWSRGAWTRRLARPEERGGHEHIVSNDIQNTPRFTKKKSKFNLFFFPHASFVLSPHKSDKTAALFVSWMMMGENRERLHRRHARSTRPGERKIEQG